MTEANFAISDKDDFTHELNEYGIDFVKGDKPVVAGRDADGNKFVMSSEFRSVTLIINVQNYLIDFCLCLILSICECNRELTWPFVALTYKFKMLYIYPQYLHWHCFLSNSLMVE